MDEAGNFKASVPVPDWEVRDGVEFVLDWLWDWAPTPAVTFISAMWRMDALRAAHGFANFADGSNSENASLISVASRGAIVFGKDALFRYRVYATSCGLSVPPERLALSSQQFRRHVEVEGAAHDALAALPAPQREGIASGVSRMLARQYLGRLSAHYLPQLGYRAVIASALRYERDAQYLRALPQFAKTLIRARVRALRNRAP